MPSNCSKSHRLVVLCLVLTLAFWLRAPFVRAGMPYFYDEDEGHHFNRVVNMVKSGDFNPHYFLKPSLHFYLRMPVTAFAFLSSVRAGELRELKEIVTKDSFGLADYSFSASHPRIAKFNRAFSVCFSLATVALTAIISIQLGLSLLGALGAALLVAVSPALVSSSAVIGVDVIVGPLVLLAVSLSLAAFTERKKSLILLSAIAAGLAASTKYNAAIVVVTPIITAILLKAPGTALLSLLISGISFLAATPFLLAELPLFLNHMAYEIWHYGIAGHAGNDAEPGIPQLKHYLTWLNTDGVGIIPLILLGISCISAVVPTSKKSFRAPSWICASFAILYFGFMCSQKANFTRNMLVMIPFVAVGAMVGLEKISLLIGKYGVLAQRVAISLIAGGLLVFSSIPTRSAAMDIPESRLVLIDFLESPIAGLTGPAPKVGIAGELQIAVRSLPPTVSTVKFPVADVDKWLLENQDTQLVVLPAGTALQTPGWAQIAQLDGDPLPMRIVKNPAIAIWKK